MTESLKVVEENRRTDGKYFITEQNDNGFIFGAVDEELTINFHQVSAFIEGDSEWADFYINKLESSYISICNERTDKWPHWIFEEFSYIENNGELRPTDDYEQRYQLAENRGIKGREA